jgi:hypothetical protein
MATKLYNVYVYQNKEWIKSNDEPLEYDAAQRLYKGLNVNGTLVNMKSNEPEPAKAKSKAKATKTSKKSNTAVIRSSLLAPEVIQIAAKILDSNGFSRYDIVKMAIANKELTYNQQVWLVNTAAQAKAARLALDTSIAALTS